VNCVFINFFRIIMSIFLFHVIYKNIQVKLYIQFVYNYLFFVLYIELHVSRVLDQILPKLPASCERLSGRDLHVPVTRRTNG
jgi:hypothetical protein